LWVQFPVVGRKIGLKRPEEDQSWLVRSCFLGIPYILSSLLAGFVGLLQTSHLQVGIPTLGTGFEILVILAVVLGGSCLGCYFGNVIGALFGALFIATLQTILTLTDISSLHRQFITGALFLIATGFCYGYNGIVSMLYHKESLSESKQA
jgi:ABC-type xylose transport system permease subunit